MDKNEKILWIRIRRIFLLRPLVICQSQRPPALPARKMQVVIIIITIINAMTMTMQQQQQYCDHHGLRWQREEVGPA